MGCGSWGLYVLGDESWLQKAEVRRSERCLDENQ